MTTKNPLANDNKYYNNNLANRNHLSKFKREKPCNRNHLTNENRGKEPMKNIIAQETKLNTVAFGYLHI